MTLFVDEDAPRLQAIADCMRKAGCHVPGWMLLLKRSHKKGASKKKAQQPVQAFGAHTAYDQQKRASKKNMILQSKVCTQVLSTCSCCRISL